MAPPPAGGAAALLQTPLLADAAPLGLPYEDGFVRLTASDVTLKRYYFPTFQGKVIKLQSIQQVSRSIGWVSFLGRVFMLAIDGGCALCPPCGFGLVEQDG